jgi:hypothetical protein
MPPFFAAIPSIVSVMTSLAVWFLVPTVTTPVMQAAITMMSTGAAGKVTVAAVGLLAFNAWHDAHRMLAWRAAQGVAIVQTYVYGNATWPIREPPDPEVQPPWHRAVAAAVDVLAYIAEPYVPSLAIVVFRWLAPVFLLVILLYQIIWTGGYFLALAAAEVTSPKATPRMTKQPVLAIVIILAWQLLLLFGRLVVRCAPSDPFGNFAAFGQDSVTVCRKAVRSARGLKEIPVDQTLSATVKRVKGVLEEQLQRQTAALSAHEREALRAAATAFRHNTAMDAKPARDTSFLRVRNVRLRDPESTELALREGGWTFSRSGLEEDSTGQVTVRIEALKAVSEAVSLDADVFALLKIDGEQAREFDLTWQSGLQRPASPACVMQPESLEQQVERLTEQLRATQAALRELTESQRRAPRGRGAGPPVGAAHQMVAAQNAKPAEPSGQRTAAEGDF